jgi:hypothetical protein
LLRPREAPDEEGRDLVHRPLGLGRQPGALSEATAFDCVEDEPGRKTDESAGEADGGGHPEGVGGPVSQGPRAGASDLGDIELVDAARGARPAAGVDENHLLGALPRRHEPRGLAVAFAHLEPGRGQGAEAAREHAADPVVAAIGVSDADHDRHSSTTSSFRKWAEQEMHGS